MSEKHQIRAQELRDKHKDFLEAEADSNFRLPCGQNRARITRALSWLEASENAVEKIESGAIQEKDGLDQSFIFLWIAFNAAYGYDPHVRAEEGMMKEKEIIEKFIRKIKTINPEANRALTELVKTHGLTFGDLLRNPFMYEGKYGGFWGWVRSYRGYLSPQQWKRSKKGREFAAENKSLKMIKNKDEFLIIVFERLRALRNQIFHGGATFGKESRNRSSVESGQKALALLVPMILKIMLDAPRDEKWRPISYPRFRPDLDGSDDEVWFDDRRIR
ncbi:MAG: HEPN domain-containing protein [Gammaproteobacteria bacterium]|nr:HEPN domain-containing protein [Gammaproteobacteria bacterium]MDD9870679.1 HEPN domain-containing protein [Gammaproteobacteria bacterium]